MFAAVKHSPSRMTLSRYVFEASCFFFIPPKSAFTFAPPVRDSFTICGTLRKSDTRTITRNGFTRLRFRIP